MKNSLLTTISCLWACVCLAQNPDIFDRPWYLNALYAEFVDPTEAADVDPPISPQMLIDSSLSYAGEIACSEFTGQLTYMGSDIFRMDQFNMTPGGCGIEEHNEFEEMFASYYYPDAEVWFILSEINGIEYLDLNFGPGYGWYFQSIPLSIAQLNLNQIALSPNPSKGLVHLEGIDQMEGTFSVHDLAGQILVQGDLRPTIDLSAQQAGIYFVTIRSGTAQRVIKVVRQ